MDDRLRRRVPGRNAFVVAVLAAALCATGAAMISPAAASPIVAAVATDMREDATRAAREARLVRAETSALLTRFLSDYADRFSAEEAERLRGYRATADRQLAGVVVTTKRLQSALSAGSSRSELVAAVRAAQRSQRRARAAADVTYDAARAILEPRLSLFEGISAIRDYDAMLGRFDRLGERIADVAREVKAA